MALPVFLYDNFADQAILAGGSWQLPLENMQDPDIEKVARSTNATNAATMFTVDLGRLSQVDGIAFGPIRLSPGATWQLTAYDVNDYVTPVFTTGVQTILGSVIDWTDPNAWFEWEDPSFWYGTDSDFDALPQFPYFVFDDTEQHQYWKLEIFDAANPDGFIQIGRLLLARAFKPAIGYDANNSLVFDPITDMVEALGGKRSFWERNLRRKATYSFPALTNSEIFGDVLRMQLKSGIGRHVFVVPDPADDEFGTRRSFLATFAKAPAIRQMTAPDGTTSFDFEEVL